MLWKNEKADFVRNRDHKKEGVGGGQKFAKVRKSSPKRERETTIATLQCLTYIVPPRACESSQNFAGCRHTCIL